VQKRIHFRFPDPPHGGNLALRLEGLGKAYGDKRLFCGLDLELSRGEKLALVGPNGAGKSTLMRLLARQEAPSEGKVVHGAGLSLGYYSPDHPEELSGTQSVLERMESWAPTHLIPQLRGLLGAFLFRDDEVFKPVGVLSGGEKSRLALLSLLLHPVNCLFLDEPTNHLDLLSKDVLLDALVRYPGTLVFVSHDRYFIEKLATRVLELEGGRARVFPGDYPYYLWRKQKEAAGEEVAPPEAPVVPKAAAGLPAPVATASETRQQSKRLQGDLRRLAREEEEILTELERLAAARRELELALSAGEVYRDGARVKALVQELEDNARRQEELNTRWEAVERELRSRQ
jgi:ATP-binding cassette subfamily F protein 3